MESGRVHVLSLEPGSIKATVLISPGVHVAHVPLFLTRARTRAFSLAGLLAPLVRALSLVVIARNERAWNGAADADEGPVR